MKLSKKAAKRFRLGDTIDVPLPPGTIMSPCGLAMFHETKSRPLVVTKVDTKRGKITLETKP